MQYQYVDSAPASGAQDSIASRRQYAVALSNSHSWPIKTFRDRDEWIKLLLAVKGTTLCPGAKVIAVRLALHLNIEDGRCNPAIGTLARGAGMSESTIHRMIRELERKGWIRVDRSRGRHANSFDLRVPTPSTVTGFNPVTSDTVGGSNPVKADRVEECPTLSTVTPQPCQNEHSNPVTVDTQKSEGRTAKRKAKEIDSPQLDLGDSESRRRKDAEEEIEAHFEEWYRHYPKHVDKADATKAYRGVITKKLATPSELLAGAMCYAAERSGQDRKYTKHPASWLNKQCWLDEPDAPITTTIDGDGTPIRTPPPDRHRTDPWMDIAMSGMRQRGQP